MSLVVMGVSGIGKTTVGLELAERLGWNFYDADDFHSAENKRKMNEGIPLTDEDRLPWLAALKALISTEESEGHEIVLACSALKRAFRQSLSEASDHLMYVFLTGPREVIEDRLKARTGHYMNPALLDSQYAALEPPTDALVADVSGAPGEIADDIVRQLRDRAPEAFSDPKPSP